MTREASDDRSGPANEPAPESEAALPAARWTRPRIAFLAGLVVFVWTIRASMLFVPVAPLGDEDLLVEAVQRTTVAKFAGASDWGERWKVQEHYSWGGRVLWVVTHLLWASVVPSEGSLALLVPLLAGVVTAAALAWTAWRNSGPDAGRMVLLLTSLSPLLLNYSLSLRGTMLSTMWLSVALACLSKRATSFGTWTLAGLCLGLSFGTHYGSGATIVALAAGLSVSLGRRVLRAPRTRDRLRASLLPPLAGAAAALAPLVTIQLWSRAADASYVARLVRHENLSFTDLGPHGLWLRKLFELDPLLAALGVAVPLLVIAARQRKTERIAAAGALVAVVLALATSVREVNTGSLTRLLIPGLTAVAISLLLRSRAAASTVPAETGSGGEPALDRSALLTSVAVLFVIFTASRPLSALARLFFPAWGLFVLVVAMELSRLGLTRARVLARGVVCLGLIALVPGLVGVFSARLSVMKADGFAASHPRLARLRYPDFFEPSTRAANCGRLARRSSWQVEVIGPRPEVYPAIAHDEEPYKIHLMRQCIDRFDLSDVLSAEQLVYGHLFFRERPAATGISGTKSGDTKTGPMKDGLRSLYDDRNPAAAANHFREVLESRQRHYGATYQLAVALDEAGEESEARVAWTKYLALAEASHDAPGVLLARQRLENRTADRHTGLMNAGLILLYEKSQPEEAAAEFEKILAENPDHYGATYQLARALDRAGKKEKARAVWRRVLAMAETFNDRPTAETARTRLAER